MRVRACGHSAPRKKRDRDICGPELGPNKGSRIWPPNDENAKGFGDVLVKPDGSPLREELATQHRDLQTQRGERKRVRRFYSLAQRMLEGVGDLFTQEQESAKVRTFGHQAPRAPQLHRQPHTASQNRTTSRSQTAQLTNLTQCTARPRQTAPRTQPVLHSQPQPTNRTLPANPT